MLSLVAATLKPRILLCFVALGVAACVEPGSEFLCDYGCTTSLPVLDEGDGLISFSTKTSSDTGSFGYGLTLVRCATGRAVTVDQYSSFIERKVLQEDVETFRTQRGLSDVNALWKMLNDRGYGPRLIQIYADDKATAKQCRKFYPKVVRSWPNKTAEQLAEEKALQEFWSDPKNIKALRDLVGATVVDDPPK
jgi:hypothetical protein